MASQSSLDKRVLAYGKVQGTEKQFMPLRVDASGQVVIPSVPVATCATSLCTPNLKLYELDSNTLSLENLLGGTYKNLIVGDLEVTGDLTAKTGRTTTYTVAASNAPDHVKAQADYVCKGFSSLVPATVIAGTGIMTDYSDWSSGTAKTVTQVGTFTVTLATGQTAILTQAELGTATSGTNTVTSGDIFTTALLGHKNTVTFTNGGAGGNLNINLPPHISAVVTSGTATVTGTPVSCNSGTTTLITTTGGSGTIFVTLSYVVQDLIAGANVVSTAVTGTLYISGMGDETEINAAITNIVTNTYGGKIHFTEGAYILSSPIIMRPRVTFEGSGINSTNIFLGNHVNDSMFKYIGITYEYFTEITNMTLSGNKENNSFGWGINNYNPANVSGLFLDGRINKIFCQGFVSGGIQLFSSWGWVIENIVVEFCGGDGIYFSNNGTNGKISNSKVIQNDKYALHLTSLYCDITNCQFGSNNNEIIYIDGQYNNISNCQILTPLGVYYNTIIAGSSNIISSCVFNATSGYHVVQISGGINNVITGCEMGQLQMQYAGIGNEVANNTITLSLYYAATTLDKLQYVRANKGYIAPGEIRTYSGTLAGVTPAGIMASVDNPFGQQVNILSIDVSYSAAGAASGTMCAGVGSSATTDYANAISVFPCDTAASATAPILCNSLRTATYGVQTTPLVWNTGAANRYVNFYAHAANNGLVGKYVITVMG
jgi:hypothetical protein